MSTTTPELEFDRSPGEAAASAAGIAQDEQVYTNFFGFSTTEKFMLPDGKQYFEIKVLNEGEKAALESASSRELIVQRRTGDAKMKIDPAGDRHALIKVAVSDWLLFRPATDRKGGWVQVPHNDREMNAILRDFPPGIIADLEAAIRKLNPSLGGDRSVEEIQAEIANLQDELDEAKRREAGKLAS